MTQEALAGRAGIHRTYVSNIECGARNVRLINSENLAQGLSTAMSELMRAAEGG